MDYLLLLIISNVDWQCSDYSYVLCSLGKSAKMCMLMSRCFITLSPTVGYYIVKDYEAQKTSVLSQPD